MLMRNALVQKIINPWTFLPNRNVFFLSRLFLFQTFFFIFWLRQVKAYHIFLFENPIYEQEQFCWWKTLTQKNIEFCRKFYVFFFRRKFSRIQSLWLKLSFETLPVKIYWVFSDLFELGCDSQVGGAIFFLPQSGKFQRQIKTVYGFLINLSIPFI